MLIILSNNYNYYVGATVIGTRCTQTKPSTAALTMFGIPLWFISNGPRLAIQVFKFILCYFILSNKIEIIVLLMFVSIFI